MVRWEGGLQTAVSCPLVTGTYSRITLGLECGEPSGINSRYNILLPTHSRDCRTNQTSDCRPTQKTSLGRFGISRLANQLNH